MTYKENGDVKTMYMVCLRRSIFTNRQGKYDVTVRVAGELSINSLRDLGYIGG